MRRILHIASRTAIDVSALRRHPAFRRLFTAQLLSQVGSQVTVATLMYQVYAITGSTLLVGLLGLVQLVPTVAFSLIGGAIADATDRRRLLLAVQVLMFAVSAALAVGSLGAPPPLWFLYSLAAIGACFAAVDGPARTAVIPALVEPATLRSAIQLREVLTHVGRVGGPLIAGVLIGQFGFVFAYALDAVSFLFAFVLFLGLPPLMPTQRRRFELSSIGEGLRFVARTPTLAATFWADIAAMVLAMPRAALPAFAATVYNVGPEGYGLLAAAIPAGAMVGLMFGGVLRHVHREGMAVIVSVAIWGAATAAFAIADVLWLGIALLAVAGWADMVSAIFRQTILLQSVPDELRGRMSSVHIMVVTGGPHLGDLRAGVTARWIGLEASVIAGGAACVAAMLVLAAAAPTFRRYARPPV